jgi:hypothetical protein
MSLRNEIKNANNDFDFIEVIERAENKTAAGWHVVNKALGRVKERERISQMRVRDRVTSDAKEI